MLVFFDDDFHRALGALEQVFGSFAQVEGFGELLLNLGLDFFGEAGEVMFFHGVSMIYDLTVGAAREPPCFTMLPNSVS